MGTNLFNSSQPETSFNQIVKEYFQVYVEDNFDSLLNAVKTENEKLTVFELIKIAPHINNEEYSAKLEQYYQNDMLAKYVYLYYKRTVSGELTKEDDLIVALNKSGYTMDIVKLNGLISKCIVALTQDYFAEKLFNFRNLKSAYLAAS